VQYRVEMTVDVLGEKVPMGHVDEAGPRVVIDRGVAGWGRDRGIAVLNFRSK